MAVVEARQRRFGIQVFGTIYTESTSVTARAVASSGEA